MRCGYCVDPQSAATETVRALIRYGSKYGAKSSLRTLRCCHACAQFLIDHADRGEAVDPPEARRTGRER